MKPTDQAFMMLLKMRIDTFKRSELTVTTTTHELFRAILDSVPNDTEDMAQLYLAWAIAVDEQPVVRNGTCKRG